MKLTTKDILLFVVMLICGTVCAFFANTTRHETPMEFLKDNNYNNPKVEQKEVIKTSLGSCTF